MDIPGSSALGEAAALCPRLAPTPDCIALSFANTAVPAEQLKNYADILQWAETSQLLPPEQAQVLREIAAGNDARGAQVLRFAINLRSVIRQSLQTAIDPNCDQYRAVEEMNTLLCSLPLRRLSRETQGYRLVWAEDQRALDQMLHDPLLDSARLLCSLEHCSLALCQSETCAGKFFCAREKLFTCPECKTAFTLVR